MQAPVNAGQDAHLLVMGTPLAPVTAGRNLHLTAHGPISAAINPTAGKNARVWSFGDIDANVTATTGDADVMTWGALNSSVVAGGYAALWSHGDADVTVHSGDFASLRTYGTAAVEINAGLDAYVWAGKEVTGSIQAAGFAGLTSLNHYDDTPATTAVSINSSGGDVAVWTLADFTGPVNAAGSAWIVTLGAVTLNNTHVGGDLLVFAVDDANVNASAGGHLMIASWGDVPLLGATGDAGAAVWCYGHLTGTLASAEGFASAVTMGDGDLANVSSGTDLYVAALGTLTVNASAGQYGTLWAGGILDGTATAGASLLAVSVEDVQLINTSAGRDLAVVAAGRILGNYSADRDVDLGANGQIDSRTRFAYDGNQIVLQFDGAAGAPAEPLSVADLSHRYLCNPAAVDQLMADEHVTDPAVSGDVLWPLADHLGTIRDLAAHDPATDTTTIVNHRTFDAYGNLLSQSTTNPAHDTLFAFTARPLDGSTGLQNNLHRWYDPATGRWMREDPIGFEGRDVNLGRYVGNSPVEYIDPIGLSRWRITTQAGKAYGGSGAGSLLDALRQIGRDGDKISEMIIKGHGHGEGIVEKMWSINYPIRFKTQ